MNIVFKSTRATVRRAAVISDNGSVFSTDVYRSLPNRLGGAIIEC